MGFKHLFRFNLVRILRLGRTHLLMALMFAVMVFAFRQVSGRASNSVQMLAVVSMFCGNFLVFNSLMCVSLLSENIFFLEKRNKIMESVFSSPASHGTVLLAKSAALAAVAWGYPLLVLGLALAANGTGSFSAFSVSHAALLFGVMPVFVFSSSVITGIFLLRAKDIRVKNMVSTGVLFAVMSLSKKVMSISKTEGFLPIFYSYSAVALVFLVSAFALYKFAYSKAAVLDSSY